MKGLILIICSLIFISCKKKNTEEHIDCISVEVDTVRLGKLNSARVIKTIGIVAPSKEAHLAFKIGGKIKRIYVEEGDKVQKGELCAILDTKDVAISKSQAQLVLEKNERDLLRIKSLYKDSAATYEQYQNIQTAYKLSLEQFNMVLEHEVQTKIFAPFDGVVAKKMAYEGEMSSPFSPLFLVQAQNKSEYKIEIGLSDKEIINIKKNDIAKVKVDALNASFINGRVSNVGFIPKNRSILYPVEIKISSNSELIRPGFTATVFLYPSNSLVLPCIPIGALVDANNNEGFVFVVDKRNNKVERRKVKIKEIVEGYIYISDGLYEGELIVSKGVNFLSDNLRVKIVNNILL